MNTVDPHGYHPLFSSLFDFLEVSILLMIKHLVLL